MSYTVTLKVELAGIPHTWITLTDENGNSVSYGYAGDDSNGDFPWPIDLGKVYKDDGTTQEKAGDEDVLLEGNGWLQRYEITQEQYQSMVDRAETIKSDPGTYLGVGNNCVDFVRDVLSVGNVPHPLGIGPHPASLIPVRQRHETLGNAENLIWLDNFLDGGLSIEEFEELFNNAEEEPVSPIILDLDGDGIETIGVKAGAYFDHAGDGFAEQTGWVGADDGLLVWDRNGDGRINDGKELFGSETLLADGTKAANGYQALSELDSNVDGIIDANDAAFGNLKVWKDLDGDGYSSTGELFSLADVGVQSINTASIASTYVDPNGNEHRLVGTFTKTDGTTGSTADVWFNRDTLYTIQEDYLAVTPDIAALPDLRGYGNVYDLQQAMVRDASGSLKSLVEQFVAEQSPGTRNQLFEQILFKWTGADTIDPASRGPYIDARRLTVLELFFGQGYVGSNGLPDPGCNTGPQLDGVYAGVFEMFYAQLLAQTHLKSLYELIAYSWDTGSQSIRGNLDAVVGVLQTQLNTDPEAGRLALSEFARSIKGLKAETILGYTAFRDTFAALGEGLGIIVDTAGGQGTLLGTTAADSLAGAVGANYIAGSGGDDVISDTGGNNTIDGGDGNDSVTVSTGGDNTIYGGAGNDSLFISYYGGASTLNGDAGNDMLGIIHSYSDPYDAGYYGKTTTFRGGSGDDRLEGSSGHDIYLFNRSDGADTILDRGYNPWGWTAYIDPDRVEFGPGIVPADLAISRSGDRLLIRIVDPANPAATDQITVENWFISNKYRIEAFAFADGTAWEIDDIHAMVNTGTEGDDVLEGWLNESLTYNALGGNDVINAQAGNDTIDGGDGNDTITDAGGNNTIVAGDGDDSVAVSTGGDNTIYGGEGNDSIFISYYGGTSFLDGGAGNDVLGISYDYYDPYDAGYYNKTTTFHGGSGDDRLEGHSGYDIYIFDRGDGHDTIRDDGRNLRGWGWVVDPDRVEFGVGITQADLVAQRNDNHLVISVNDPANPQALDRITVENWFLSPTYHIETFTFTDGTSLTDIQMEELVNYAPIVANPLADYTTTEDASLNIVIPSGAFSDPDNDALTYNATLDDGSALPAWLVFDAATGTFSGTPGNAEVGVFSIRVTANDPSGESVSDTFLLTVQNVNDTPTVAQALTDQTASEDAAFTYILPADAFADVDAGDVLTLSTALADGSALPTWLTFDAATGTFSGTPANEDVGNISIRVTATDTSGASADSIFILTVTNTNDTPFAVNPIPDVVAVEDSAFNFAIPAGTFGDVDSVYGDTLSHAATLSDGSALPAWLNFDAATQTFSGMPANADVGSISIRVTAMDSAGASVNQLLSLTVANTNDAPVIMAPIADQDVSEGQTWSFTVPAATFDDMDVGDSLSYMAMLADGSALPGWLNFDTATRTFSGTPTNGYSGIYDIQMTATDTTGAFVSDAFSLTVADTISNVFTGTSGKDVLTGTVGADTLQGLAGADTLYGYGGNDLLHGGAGNDTLAGGTGDDTYVVDANGDAVIESTDEGIDTVQSSISHTLAANVENLVLTGGGKINGTGNELDNVLIGNAANNALSGAAGGDTLDGGAGNDTLIGGTGDDTYVFNRGYGNDTIQENDATSGNVDTAKLGVNPLNVVFARSGNDLAVSLHGGTDTLTVQNWYAGSQYRTEQLKASDDSVLLDTQVERLIQAMATFGAENGGISWDQAIDQRPEDVQAILAANWMPAT